MFPENISIDIDVAQKSYIILVKEYYYCEDPNFIVCEYLIRLYVWQLTAKQWKELIEELYILKNMEII